jgi:flavin-dependent dehydrogenase
MERVDVAIVGGGPAGSSAAYEAAAGDANALVLEKGVPRADRARAGPDSTDAAGLLDYWIDLMDFDPEQLPDCRFTDPRISADLQVEISLVSIPIGVTYVHQCN